MLSGSAAPVGAHRRIGGSARGSSARPGVAGVCEQRTCRPRPLLSASPGVVHPPTAVGHGPRFTGRRGRRSCCPSPILFRHLERGLLGRESLSGGSSHRTGRPWGLAPPGPPRADVAGWPRPVSVAGSLRRSVRAVLPGDTVMVGISLPREIHGGGVVCYGDARWRGR